MSSIGVTYICTLGPHTSKVGVGADDCRVDDRGRKQTARPIACTGQLNQYPEVGLRSCSANPNERRLGVRMEPLGVRAHCQQSLPQCIMHGAIVRYCFAQFGRSCRSGVGQGGGG